MFECTVRDVRGRKWFNLKGRIDSMSSPDLEKRFLEIIRTGERKMIACLTEVVFISSAGLRAFLTALKAMRQQGGDIILYDIPQNILEVFKLSGFDRIFKIINAMEEIQPEKAEAVEDSTLTVKTINGILFRSAAYDAESGAYSIIGSTKKLPYADYTSEDIVTVKPSEIKYGIGIAALARSDDPYEDYRNLFGEALVIDGNFFVYPAMENPAVDFMLDIKSNSNLEYKYFNGFSFSGDFNYIASFERQGSPIELNDLGMALFEITQANKIGVVFLAKSKGFMGMHMKKIPIQENKPKNKKKIYDSENFYEWINYDIEYNSVDHVIAGAGLIVNDQNVEDPEIQSMVSRKKNTHLYACVFGKQDINTGVHQFRNELRRVIAKSEPQKVQHMLDKCLFSSGVVGIIDLDVFRL